MQASIFLQEGYVFRHRRERRAESVIVYSPTMPMHIPPLLLLKQLAQQTAVVVLFALRAILVAIIWLAILPWATIWTWRMYFTVGDST